MARVVFSGLTTRRKRGSPSIEPSMCSCAPKLQQAELMSIPGASMSAAAATRLASAGIAMSG